MSFDDDAKRIEQGLNTAVGRIITKGALSVLSTVVLASPVGDPNLWKVPKAPPGYAGGRFRGNWTVSVGSEDDTVKKEVDPAGTATIAAGKAVLGDGVPLEPKIFIQNNLPYAQRLNEGWSSQAPAGFIEKAIVAGFEALDGEGEILP